MSPETELPINFLKRTKKYVSNKRNHLIKPTAKLEESNYMKYCLVMLKPWMPIRKIKLSGNSDVIAFQFSAKGQRNKNLLSHMHGLQDHLETWVVHLFRH